MTNPSLDLITSQHRRPRYQAVVDAITAPAAEVSALLEALRRAFDLDTAVGVQLDQVGQWIGRTRHLRTPLEGVYFAWDEPGVGWQEGSWKGLYDPDSGLTRLPDDVYRHLLRAKVAANGWDGTRDGAYAIWEAAFAAPPDTPPDIAPDTQPGSIIVIQDHQDMSIAIGLAGTPPNAILEHLLLQGWLPLRPAGVRIAWYALPPTPSAGGSGALFAWDCDSPALSGWPALPGLNGAAWPRILTPQEDIYAP